MDQHELFQTWFDSQYPERDFVGVTASTMRRVLHEAAERAWTISYAHGVEQGLFLAKIPE